jgi:hypothetical protein
VPAASKRVPLSVLLTLVRGFLDIGPVTGNTQHPAQVGDAATMVRVARMMPGQFLVGQMRVITDPHDLKYLETRHRHRRQPAAGRPARDGEFEPACPAHIGTAQSLEAASTPFLELPAAGEAQDALFSLSWQAGTVITTIRPPSPEAVLVRAMPLGSHHGSHARSHLENWL